MDLVLTLDYELYGDGTGDVFHHIIDPTEKILEICAKHNIKITVFFEILEYLKIKGQRDAGNLMGYAEDPVEAIEKQIKMMALSGHDVQLHVHPQWHNAIWDHDHWVVDFDNWRLGGFDSSDGYTIESMLREGKAVLESLIKPVLPDYECIALRAGGYNVMPSEAVYDAMLSVGLKVDSSVFPGGYEVGNLSRYDYRGAATDLDYWPVRREDFCQKATTGEVLEVPIFAIPQRRFWKLSLSRVLSVVRSKRAARTHRSIGTQSKSLFQKLSYMIGRESFTWDFCLFGMALHKRFFQKIFRDYRGREIFVLVGHPKGFVSGRDFEKMICYSKEKGFSFVTLKCAVANGL